MKKLLFILLLLIPFIVSAEDFEYTIKSKVELEGRELEGNDFTFDLIDSEGNIIQTKKNDKDGNIVFDPINFEEEYVGVTILPNETLIKYKIYLIRQRNEHFEGYTYDEQTAYVGAYYRSDGGSEIAYLKDIDKIKKETTYYESKSTTEVYHATEEDLQGQAYAVYDSTTQTLTFFRDEEGKYTDEQVDGTKKYYTGFEDGSLYLKWQTWYSFYHFGLQAMTGYYTGNTSIKKIVFEDHIKPKNIANPDGGTSWFSSMENLEEIVNIDLLDTSEVTTFTYLFEGDHKLTYLDLNAWDTSKVTDMKMMFANCYNLEELYIDNFDTSNVNNISYMFEYTYKLKNINQKMFNLPKLRNGDLLFFNSKTIQGLDTSTWNIQDEMATSEIAYYMESLVYLNVSTLPGLWSEAISGDPNLAIIDLAGSYNVMYTNIGTSAFWYNINNDTLYTRDELRTHLVNLKDLEPATYVRPVNNPEPSLFKNKYIPIDITAGSSNALENPNTGNLAILLISAIAIISGLLLIIQKRKLNFLR